MVELYLLVLACLGAPLLFSTLKIVCIALFKNNSLLLSIIGYLHCVLAPNVYILCVIVSLSIDLIR